MKKIITITLLTMMFSCTPNLPPTKKELISKEIKCPKEQIIFNNSDKEDDSGFFIQCNWSKKIYRCKEKNHLSYSCEERDSMFVKARWKKGDSRTYFIHSSLNFINGNSRFETKEMKTTYKMTVVDIKEKHYIVRWKKLKTFEKQISNNKKKSKSFIDHLFYSLKIKTDRNGKFIELMNWQELSNKTLEFFYKISSEIEILDKRYEFEGWAEDTYSKKEIITNVYASPMVQIHNLYGKKYHFNDRQRHNSTIKNILVDLKPLPTIALETLRYIDFNKNIGFIDCSHKINQTQSKNPFRDIVNYIFPSLALKTILNFDNYIKIEQDTSYVFDYKAGWVNKMNYTRNLTILGNEYIDKIDVKMIYVNPRQPRKPKKSIATASKTK